MTDKNFPVTAPPPLQRPGSQSGGARTAAGDKVGVWCAADAVEWSREQVTAWLQWLVSQCELDAPSRRGAPVDWLGRLTTLNGRQLSRLSRDDIARLTRNPHVADVVWSSFNLLLGTAATGKGAGRTNAAGSRPLFHAKFRRN